MLSSPYLNFLCYSYHLYFKTNLVLNICIIRAKDVVLKWSILFLALTWKSKDHCISNLDPTYDNCYICATITSMTNDSPQRGTSQIIFPSSFKRSYPFCEIIHPLVLPANHDHNLTFTNPHP